MPEHKDIEALQSIRTKLIEKTRLTTQIARIDLDIAELAFEYKVANGFALDAQINIETGEAVQPPGNPRQVAPFTAPPAPTPMEPPKAAAAEPKDEKKAAHSHAPEKKKGH